VEAELLKEMVDAAYFPISPLLWPILEKAQAYDGKGYFSEGFQDLRTKLESRHYTSVSVFSTDLITIFDRAIGVATSLMTGNMSEMRGTPLYRSLTAEQKERKKVAGRILRSVQPLLADAKRKELELAGGKPFEKELQDLNDMFNMNQLVRRSSLAMSVDDEMADMDITLEPASTENGYVLTNGTKETQDVTMLDLAPAAHGYSSAHDAPLSPNSNKKFSAEPSGDSPQRMAELITNGHHVPLSPPSSADGNPLSWLVNGGRPWYLEPVDLSGITLHEERWTGQEVLRELSEELSELDDEAMEGLEYGEGNEVLSSVAAALTSKKKKPARKGKSNRRR
jgi:NuA3 HAT complex component NTO1